MMRKLITILFILMAFSGYSQFESTFSQIKILDSLKLVKDAAAGKVLTSDIYGVGTWQDAAGGFADADVDSLPYIRADLAWTRYDSIDRDLGASYFENNLVNWRKAFINSEVDNSENMKIEILGDSYTTHYGDKLKGLLSWEYGFGGGFELFIKNTNPTGNEMDEYKYIYQTAWSYNTVRSDDYNPFNREISTASTTDDLHISTRRFNTTRILYRKVSGGGTFSVQIGENGTPENVSTDAADGVGWYYLEHEVLEFPKDTLLIKCVSGTIKLIGHYLSYEDDKSLVVHIIGDGGARVFELYDSKDVPTMNTIYDTLDPKLIFLTFLDAPTSLYERASYLVDTLRYVTDTLCDIAWVSTNDEKDHRNITERGIFNQLAKDKDIGLINITERGGDLEELLKAGVTTDSVHYAYEGDYIFYQIVTPYLFPQINYEINGNSLLMGKEELFFDNSSNIYTQTDSTTTTISGIENIAFGKSIRDRTISGDYNILSGDAGGVALSGDDNIILGRQAGEIMTTGSDNILLGFKAGQVLTTAGDNVFIGNSTGRLAVGTQNMFLGAFAGNLATTANNNTAVGYYAGQTASSMTNCTYLGWYSGRNKVGTHNVTVGSLSGGSGISGNYNTFIGASSGLKGTGDKNIMIGYKAGDDVTTGTHLYISNGSDNSIKAATWIYGNSSYDIEIPNGDLTVMENYNGTFHQDSIFKMIEATSSVRLTSYIDLTGSLNANDSIYVGTSANMEISGKYKISSIAYTDSTEIIFTASLPSSSYLYITLDTLSSIRLNSNVNVQNDLSVTGTITAGAATHLFYYYGDSTISLSYTTSWQHLTNTYGEMWIYDESDGFTVSGDTITVTEAGDYDFTVKNVLDGGNGHVVSMRLYNVTQSDPIPVAGAATMRSSGNYNSITVLAYYDCAAGDKIVIQYKGDANGTSVFKNGIIKIYLIHN